MVDMLINSPLGLFDVLKSASEATVKFIKKDGNARVMTCTLDFSKIPEEHHPKSRSEAKSMAEIQEKRLLRVYDLTQKGWRCLLFDSLDWVEAKDSTSEEISFYNIGGKQP